ncbi:hypothetical protein OC844_007773, partial [Tilletia horrida]
VTAHGPFIVEGNVPSIHKSVREERTLVLGDWYWQESTKIAAGLLANPFRWPGSVKSIVLNGRGLNACNATVAQLNAKLSCADTSASPSVISVPYSTSVRLRLIGAHVLSYTAFGILSHTLDIIAADGTYLEPIRNQAHVEILPGQGTIWFCGPIARARTMRAGQPLPPGTTTDSAHLLPGAKFGWIADEFAPLRWSGADRMADAPRDEEVVRRIVIHSQQIRALPNDTGSRFIENGHTYNEDDTTPVPYLIKIFNKLVDEPSYERAMQGTPKGYDKLTDTYVAKSGEVFDVVLINNASELGRNVESHPWHGHSFKQWTIASGMGNFSEQALTAARAHGYKRPIARDTHAVWPGPGASALNETLPANSSGGWTMIRYRVAQDGLDA